MWILRVSFGVAAFALILVTSAIAGDVVVLTEENFEKEVGEDRGALVKFYAPWCDHCKKLAPEYEEVAASSKGTTSVIIGEVDCDQNADLCDEYEVAAYPSVMWFPKGSLEPKEYKGGRNAEELIDFVNEEGGTNIRLPTTPSDVVILTSDNFDEIVYDKKKDVLVEFQARWCSHCKVFAPIYNELAAAFKMEDNVVIASIDGDENSDISKRFDIRGFPMLKFFPKKDKSGRDYRGGRELYDLVTFINRKCKTRRDLDGSLTSEAGVLNRLDSFVKEFVSASSTEEIESAYKQLEAEVNKLKGSAARYGKIYLKIAENCKGKCSEYTKTETQRLERVLAQSISAAKADELTLKKNILSTFVAKK